MPELPEVESVRKGLENTVLSKTIKKTDIYWNNIIESPNPDQFKKLISGQMIHAIDRRGKFLLFELTDYVLISHLRMEGKYFYKHPSEELEKHTHVVFHFSDDTELRYNDVRKFGKMSLVPKEEASQHKSLVNLGPEPTEEALDETKMAAYLETKSRAIKMILLDQTFVAGVGNIYADEILYRAKINPKRPGNTLTKAEITSLRRAIIDILSKSIEYGGSTIRTYHNMLGDDGTYQQFHQVYGKTGEPCPVCGEPIVKIQLQGRGTHYCPHCQPERKA